MKKWGLFVISILLGTGISCGSAEKKGDEDLVLIKTPHGNIKVMLYEKTAEHKKNFGKLVKEGFFDGLLFHRVIENFMIQGGDPDSKNSTPGQKLGGGSLEYTLPAEIIPEYYHKRGAVAAARRGGPANPEKRSSASQFYIVQGRIFSHGALDTLEMSKYHKILNEMMREQMLPAEVEIRQLRENNDRDGFNLKMAEIRNRADSLIEIRNMKFKFTDEQRMIYTTIGGYPTLDGEYTVFGEVVEGMEVVDKIAASETDNNDRPFKDIKMEIELIQ